MRWLMILGGLAFMAWGFVYDASVASGGYGAVMNLGLIAEKQMIFAFGAVLFLAGCMFEAANRIQSPTSPTALPQAKEPVPSAPTTGLSGEYTVGPGFKGPR